MEKKKYPLPIELKIAYGFALATAFLFASFFGVILVLAVTEWLRPDVFKTCKELKISPTIPFLLILFLGLIGYGLFRLFYVPSKKAK